MREYKLSEKVEAIFFACYGEGEIGSLPAKEHRRCSHMLIEHYYDKLPEDRKVWAKENMDKLKELMR